MSAALCPLPKADCRKFTQVNQCCSDNECDRCYRNDADAPCIYYLAMEVADGGAMIVGAVSYNLRADAEASRCRSLSF
jgi:hypothetical protein